MVTTSVTIEEFIPGDRYNAGTIQQRQVDVELIEKEEDSEWIWIDKKYTYDIIEHSYTDMDDFILRVEIDICSRSFSLLSENGDSRLIKCDTKEEFIRILRVCDELLLPDQVVYKELATQKDK